MRENALNNCPTCRGLGIIKTSDRLPDGRQSLKVCPHYSAVDLRPVTPPRCFEPRTGLAPRTQRAIEAMQARALTQRDELGSLRLRQLTRRLVALAKISDGACEESQDIRQEMADLEAERMITIEEDLAV